MSAADSMIPSSAEAKAALRRICSASRSASGGFASSFPAEAAVSSPDGRREEEGLLPSAARPLSPCVSRSLPLPLLNARLLRPSFCCFSLDGVDGAHERGNASRCSRALQWLAEGGPAFARLLVREETPLAESDFAAESTAEEEDHPMGSWQYVLEDENWAGFIVQSKRRSFSSSERADRARSSERRRFTGCWSRRLAFRTVDAALRSLRRPSSSRFRRRRRRGFFRFS